MSVFAPSGPAPLSTVAIQGSQAPVIANVDMPSAGTEYSYFFPAGTKRFKFKLRGLGKLQFSWIAAESGSNYYTIWPGAEHEEDTITLSTGMTIYFQSSSASQVLEVSSWS